LSAPHQLPDDPAIDKAATARLRVDAAGPDRNDRLQAGPLAPTRGLTRL
jgi:hypothetical protein